VPWTSRKSRAHGRSESRESVRRNNLTSSIDDNNDDDIKNNDDNSNKRNNKQLLIQKNLLKVHNNNKICKDNYKVCITKYKIYNNNIKSSLVALYSTRKPKGFISNPFPLRKGENAKDISKLDKVNLGRYPFDNKNGRIIDVVANAQPDRAADKANRVKLRQADLTRTPEGTSTSKQLTTTRTSSYSGTTSNNYTTNDNMSKTSRNRNSSSKEGATNQNRFSYTPTQWVGTTSPFNNRDASEPGIYDIIGQTSKVTLNDKIDVTYFLNQGQVNQNTTLVNPYEHGGRLYINIANFYYPMSTLSSVTNSYLTNIMSGIYNRYTNDILRKAKSAIYTSWTGTPNYSNFTSYLGAVITAMEYYYAIDSVLSYNEDTVGSYMANKSLTILKNLYSTNDLLLARNKLRVNLKGQWLPPKLSELIRWYYQNYKVSEQEQAVSYRYIPDGNFVFTNNTTALSSLITTNIVPKLALTTNQNICAMLSDAYPQGIIMNLPPSYTDICYDPTHLEMYINEPLIYSDPNNSNTTSVFPISYLGLNNDVAYYTTTSPKVSNGVAFALQTMNFASGSSGNVFVANNFTGLREIATYNTGTDVSNKIFYDFTNIGSPTVISRTDYNQMKLRDFTSAHSVIDKSGVTSPVSTTVNGTQRVYYSNANAPTVVFEELMDTLFALKI